MFELPVRPERPVYFFSDGRSDLSGYDYCGDGHLLDDYYEELIELWEEAEEYFYFSLKGELPPSE